ncbi:hypothetical protein M3Y96_00127900 [Aphelenchoides besseyi]|nr:hypothetical protein M3Y96_00127900 [Aphelenchoides besseyi]
MAKEQYLALFVSTFKWRNCDSRVDTKKLNKVTNRNTKQFRDEKTLLDFDFNGSDNNTELTHFEESEWNATIWSCLDSRRQSSASTQSSIFKTLNKNLQTCTSTILCLLSSFAERSNHWYHN